MPRKDAIGLTPSRVFVSELTQQLFKHGTLVRFPSAPTFGELFHDIESKALSDFHTICALVIYGANLSLGFFIGRLTKIEENILNVLLVLFDHVLWVRK